MRCPLTRKIYLYVVKIRRIGKNLAIDRHTDYLEIRVGSGEEAFPTLQAARDHLRNLRSSGPLSRPTRVVVDSTTLELSQSFTLSAIDGGTAEAPVVYSAEKAGSVRLLGGQRLAHFTPVRDPSVLARLSEDARKNVLQIDLKALGVEPLGSLSSRGFSRPITPAHTELFFDGRRMQLARWPSREWAHIDRPALTGDDQHGGQLGDLEAGFFFADSHVDQWQSLEDVWMHGYWGWDWANSYEAVCARDASSGLIRTHPPHGLYGFRSGARFYFLNALEALSQPGDYYANRQSGLLYFWPPAPIESAEAAVSVLDEPLLQIEGTQHVRFEGFSLEYGRGSGIYITDSESVVIADSTVRNVGNHGIVVKGGQRCEVLSCNVYHCGDSGLVLSGGDRKTLQPGRHRAADNHIHHMGEWSRCYQPGIHVLGVGQRIEHNLIHDGPHNGILLSGNEHIIEYNHIHHVCQESGDVGAFYMGRDWSECGNVLRYNFFHHTQGVGMGSMAVYLDDCASSTTIFGNIFYQCTRAVLIGGGRNNRVENNIFIKCEPAIHLDGRGLDMSPVWQSMVHETMKTRLDAVDHLNPPYSTRYPDLRQLDAYYAERRGIPPEGNLIVRNICCGPWIDIRWHADPKIVAVQNNMVDEDPFFVDAEGMDFQLRIDSPAYEIGFKKIPADKIGPRRILPK